MEQYIVLQTGSGSIEVVCPIEKVKAICHSGSNDIEVEDLWVMGMVQKQLQKYSNECLEREFKELGIEEDNRVFTRADMEHYLLWSLCWDIMDSGNIDNTDEYLNSEDILRLNLV